MELKIIEDTKNKVIIEIHGENNTFANALKQELWNDEDVKTSGYHVDHPLTNVPRLVVETKNSEAKKALQEAVKRLEKTADKFGDAFSKAK